MGGTCNLYREMKNPYKILVRKLKVKRLLGRHKYRWKYNIKMDIRVKGSMVLIGWNWLRTGSSVNMLMNHQVP
jgi:hypothetical protein